MEKNKKLYEQLLLFEREKVKLLGWKGKPTEASNRNAGQLLKDDIIVNEGAAAENFLSTIIGNSMIT